MLAKNSSAATTGIARTRLTREWVMRSRTSRGPHVLSVRAGTARKSSVRGAAGTRNRGTVMAIPMCMTMCIENSTRPQMSGVPQVSQIHSSQPSIHKVVRHQGQASPRRRSRMTAAAYRPMAMSATARKSQLIRQAVNH